MGLDKLRPQVALAGKILLAGCIGQPPLGETACTSAVGIDFSGNYAPIAGLLKWPSVIGQLEMATFVNEGGLSAQGSNLFLETGASGPATVATPGSPGLGTLTQGYTEASNVDAVTEITALIVAQRAYEMSSKVITTADAMLGVTSQLKS